MSLAGKILTFAIADKVNIKEIFWNVERERDENFFDDT